MLLGLIHQLATKSPASQTICIVWARWRQTRKTHMTSHWDIVCCGLLPDEETSVTCFDSDAQLAADSSHCPSTCLPWPRTWICSGFCDLTLISQLLSEWVTSDQVQQKHKHRLQNASSLSEATKSHTLVFSSRPWSSLTWFPSPETSVQKKTTPAWWADSVLHLEGMELVAAAKPLTPKWVTSANRAHSKSCWSKPENLFSGSEVEQPEPSEQCEKPAAVCGGRAGCGAAC